MPEHRNHRYNCPYCFKKHAVSIDNASVAIADAHTYIRNCNACGDALEFNLRKDLSGSLHLHVTQPTYRL